MNKVSIQVGITGDANKKLGTLSGGFAALGRSMGGMLQIAGGMFIFDTITGIFGELNRQLKTLVTSSTQVSADFDSAMRKVGAVTNATGDELKELTKVARENAKTSKFTSREAADAMGFLAMAGFDVKQTMEALPGTLQLATAANLDLASSADIVSNVLTGYGIEIKNLGRVNDVLVKTLTRTNTDLTQLGEAFKYVGTIAKVSGVEFEETAAAIGLLGNAGIQGSMAGTTLRGALSKLQSPTRETSSTLKRLRVNVYEADGSLRSLVDIIRQLEVSGADAGDLMEIFGKIAGPGMAALIEQGSDALEGLTEELRQSGGTAERISDQMMAGPGGAFLQFQSIIEDFQISFGDVINDFLMGSGVIDVLGKLVNQASIFFMGFGASVEQRMPVLTSVFQELAEKVHELLVELGILGPEAKTAMQMGEDAGNGFVDMVINLLAKAIEFTQYLIDNKEEVKAYLEDGKQGAKDFLELIKKIVKAVDDIAPSLLNAMSILKGFTKIAGGNLGGGGDLLRGIMGKAGKATGGGMNGGFIRGYKAGGFVDGIKVGTGRDNILVRAEKDEVILNKKQQSNIMSQLDRGGKKEVTMNNYFQSFVDPESVATMLAFQLSGL